MPLFLAMLFSCTPEETPAKKPSDTPKKTQTIVSAPSSTDKNAASMVIKIDQNAKYEDEGKPRGQQEEIVEEENHQPSFFSYAIEVQKTEVTQKQFQDSLGWNPSYFGGCGDECVQNSTTQSHANEDSIQDSDGSQLKSECFDVNALKSEACGEDCPVESVSWYDAIVFTNARSKAAGLPPCFTLQEIRCTDGTKADADEKKCMSNKHNGIAFAKVQVNAEKPYLCTGFRLLTGAEWEQVALQGASGPLYTSADNDGSLKNKGCTEDSNLSKIAWYGANSGGKPHPVGQKDPNSLGIYDIFGNIWEWTIDDMSRPDLKDGFSYDPKSSDEEQDTQTEEQEDCEGFTDTECVQRDRDRQIFSTLDKQQRGGSWLEFGSYCQAKEYTSMPPGDRDASTGFRMVRTTKTP